MWRNTNKKRIKAGAGVLLLWSLVNAPSSYAQINGLSKITLLDTPDKIYSGTIGNLDTYSFQLAESESILIEVSQPNADLKLALFDAEHQLLFEAGIPARDWSKEKILIDSKMCTYCYLQILPVENVDNSGSYFLSSKRLLQDSHEAQITFERAMTLAAIKWLQAKDDRLELQQTRNYYLEAFEFANTLSLEQEKQKSLYFIAKINHLLTDYDDQKKNLLEAKAIGEDHGITFLSKIIFDLGDVELGNEQFEQSILYFDEAFELARQQNDKLLQAKISSRLGLIHNSRGEFNQAVEKFISSHNTFLESGDWRSAIERLINIGWSHYRLTELEQALNFYHQALSFATKTKLLKYKVEVLTKIGSVYYRMGDIEQSLSFIDKALRNSHQFPHSLLDGRAKQAKAKTLYNAGMFELSRDYFDEALTAYSLVGSKSDMIDIHYSLEKVQNSLGYYSKSEKSFRKVLEYDKKNDISYDIGMSYNRLAELALEQNKYKTALEYQKEAITHLKNIEDEHIKGELYSQAAIVYFHAGLLNESQQYITQSKRLMNNNRDVNGLIKLGFRIAKIEKHKGNIKQAIETLSIVIEQIEQNFNHLTRGDIRRNYLALQKKIVGLQIRLKIEVDTPAIETLKLSERFRTKTLNERLANVNNNFILTFKQTERRAALQSALQSQIISYNQLSNSISRNKIIKETRKTASELQLLEASFKINKMEQKRQNTQLTDINKIQQLLDSDSLILYFDTNSQQSHLWTISNTKTEYFELPSDEILSEQVANILRLVNVSPGIMRVSRTKKQRSMLDKISVTLLGHKGITWKKYKKIIVIPDGPLHYLPLSLLNFPANNKMAVESKQISYMPSLEAFQLLSNRKTRSNKKNKDFLLVSNPKMLFDTKSESNVVALRSGFETRELPYTKKEADSIVKVSDRKILQLNRENANKGQLYSTPLTDYEIMHFATHGIANSHAPALGGLVLSNASSTENILLASEIINLEINAELVVLSGCETAMGQLITGEGLQGLSRAFFEAGAKRVIASLWPVQDDATAELMGAFYRFLLKEKKSPAESLRLAKLYAKNYQRKDHRKPWRDPFYWAGFVLQGIGDAWIE